MNKRQNILFLFTGQQRADSLGCYGNPVCQTPNLDRLAAEGVRFHQAYTPTSICTPARASILTGVMPHKHRLLANFERKEKIWLNGGKPLFCRDSLAGAAAKGLCRGIALALSSPSAIPRRCFTWQGLHGLGRDARRELGQIGRMDGQQLV